MHGIIKAMIIKELLTNQYVVGYQFKKTLAASNIIASNGAIFYNLKKFEEQDFVYTVQVGKTKQYVLTERGKQEFQKNLDTIPVNIEITMQELGSQIPFLNWTSVKDIQKFNNSIKKLSVLVDALLEENK